MKLQERKQSAGFGKGEKGWDKEHRYQRDDNQGLGKCDSRGSWPGSCKKDCRLLNFQKKKM